MVVDEMIVDENTKEYKVDKTSNFFVKSIQNSQKCYILKIKIRLLVL